jgi:biopolymer transport protein TolR
MSLSRRGGFAEGITRANVTPLADVTTTLIVVFLITMPAIMWNGINVRAAEAGNQQQVLTQDVKAKDEIVTVRVEPAGLTVNGQRVDREDLPAVLQEKLAASLDRTVVVLPAQAVTFGVVVEVLDVAKASGAESLALLNQTGGRP